MQKEMNPDLFGTVGGAVRPRPRSEETSINHRQNLQLEDKIAEIRVQVNFALEQMENLVSQVNEYIQSSQLKFERLQGALHQMQQSDRRHQEDASQKFAHVHMRLNERKGFDSKVQEMIDRQNGILKTYEVRMNQLQRLLQEREAQIMSAQASLNEAKMEISRLKRL